jgi:alpha-tubulin suppressor-like RCC1 family protein
MGVEIKSISCGENHTLAVMKHSDEEASKNILFAWGSNDKS